MVTGREPHPDHVRKLIEILARKLALSAATL